MPMSKKHFEAIAASLSYTRPPTRTHARHEQWATIVDEMADTCQRLGQNFNRQRFLEACHDRTFWKGRV